MLLGLYFRGETSPIGLAPIPFIRTPPERFYPNIQISQVHLMSSVVLREKPTLQGPFPSSTRKCN
ncbi:hypothetical protein D9M71_841330 [compost metagenome]